MKITNKSRFVRFNLLIVFALVYILGYFLSWVTITIGNESMDLLEYVNKSLQNLRSIGATDYSSIVSAMFYGLDPPMAFAIVLGILLYIALIVSVIFLSVKTIVNVLRRRVSAVLTFIHASVLYIINLALNIVIFAAVRTMPITLMAGYSNLLSFTIFPFLLIAAAIGGILLTQTLKKN